MSPLAVAVGRAEPKQSGECGCRQSVHHQQAGIQEEGDPHRRENLGRFRRRFGLKEEDHCLLKAISDL